MPDDLAVNEHFSVQTQSFGHEHQPVIIVDDYLRDPEAMVRYAANEAKFKPSPTMYPGIIAPVPVAYIESLLSVLGPLIGQTFGVKVETAYLSESFFAIVTTPPEELHYRQRLPHVDDYDPGMIAILHYLCNGEQGGTALYRHRATGYESLTLERNQRLQSLIAQDISGLGPVPQQYSSVINRLFEPTASFEAKFNRLIVYRGSILHSMLTNPNTKLNSDPRVGRLTTNTFLRFEVV